MTRATFQPNGGTDTQVKVEFVPGPRVPEEKIAGADSAEIAARSQHALNVALEQIREVVERVARMQGDMPANLKQMQVDFGIKLDWEAGALLANNQQEASITVKLTWDRDAQLAEEGLPVLVEEVPAPAAPITPTGLIQAIEVLPGDEVSQTGEARG